MRNILKSLFVVMGCLLANSVLADATLFTADFTTWTPATYSEPTFVNGVYFNPKSKKTILIDATGVNFNGQNASGASHSIGIPVSGVNGSIKITITNDYEGKSYKYKAGYTDGSDYQSANPSMSDKFSKTLEMEITNITGTDVVFWIGEAGSSYKSIKSITITTPGSASPVAVTGVKLNKTSLTLEAGQSETLTATVQPDNATNKNISWTSDKPGVATVDANGKVDAVAAGTANITVTTEDGGKTAICAVTVTAPAAPIEVESISIKASTTLKVGDTETLSVTYTPSNANTGKGITWTSDKPGIATVDANGVVKGVAAGTAVITATTENGKTASCNVTVTADGPTPGPTPGPSGNVIFDWIIAGSSKIENDGTDLSQANYGTLNVGTSVTGRLLASNQIEYNSKGYKLANNDVCIEIQGSSAFQAGDVVTITGVCGGSGERGFTITPSSATSASSSDGVNTNLIGNTEVNNFTATITAQQAGDKLRIFRLAGKTMYLSAIKVERGGSTPTDPVAVTGVTLNKTSLTLEAGQSETLTATVQPDNATNKNISWTSDKPGVATVDANGKVDAVAAGTANITVTTEDGGKTNTCIVTVTPPAAPIEVESISIKASTTLKVGDTETLSVTYTPSNANTGKGITWTSDKPGIATVDANGVVKGVAAGTAVITATTENGKTASCNVTVTADGPTPGPTPGPSGNVIFDWIIAGSSKIENDGTDLSQANYGTLNVGTSVTGRLLASNQIEYNSKGYKLANNDVCIEIQGSSAFQAGDVVTITGVCGGSGERGFTITPSSATSASSSDGVNTNLIGNTEVNNFTATITAQQAGDKLRIFRLAGKTMYLSAIKVERGGSTPTDPVAVTGVTLNKTSLTLEAGQSETLTATVQPDNATNKNISWTSDKPGVATVDANGKVDAVAAGTANITVTTEDGGKTNTCIVTVTPPAAPIEVESISIKASTTLKVGDTETLSVTYTPSNANTGKGITWTSDKPGIATVDANGVVKGVAAGNAVITATSEGGFTATCNVTVTEEDPEPEPTPAPSTDLDLHEPGVYEKSTLDKGYGLDLVINESREYEVYYLSNNSGDFISAGATKYDMDKNGAVGYVIGKGSSGKVDAGWVRTVSSSSYSSKAALNEGEFNAANSNYLQLTTSSYIELHVKGFDQFSMMANDKAAVTPDSKTGKDKKADQHIRIIINGDTLERKAEDMQTTDPSLFRFEIKGEQVIKIMGTGTTANRFRAFSLRVAQEPRTQYLEGNDTTQKVIVNTAIEPILYYTKYNSKGETKLEWENGVEATGITLSKVAEGSIGDTLVVSGTPHCRAGLYKFSVVSYFKGKETSRSDGKINVAYKLRELTDLNTDAYQNEEMDPIQFRCYVYDETDVNFKWENDDAPQGVTTGLKGNLYSIGGTPTVTGKFKYSISIEGSDTLSGVIDIAKADYGSNPVLYLYKNTKDGVYHYLTSRPNNPVNLIARKAKEDGVRESSQYKLYKWVLISDDVNADNPEVKAILMEGASNLPILNMNAFTYAYARDEDNPNGRGEPDNGSLTQKGCNITIQRDDHPIFKSLGKKRGDTIQVLETVNQKGLMPINIFQQNTLCLATALTRSDTSYYGDGEPQTIIHEIPASMRGGQKYICFPISKNSTNNLTADGKKLLDAIVSYLTSNEATVAAPEVDIDKFIVEGETGLVDYVNQTIKVRIDTEKHPDFDITAVAPTITLKSEYTTVTPGSGEAVDFSTSIYLPIQYVVTDYITRKVYNVEISAYSSQGIEEVYAVGDWINVYDIFGRKIATTNENIYTMSIPHGVYIIVMENGQTFKISR